VKLSGPLEVWFADVSEGGDEDEKPEVLPTEGGQAEGETEAHPS
jgi:hypothetical protein